MKHTIVGCVLIIQTLLISCHAWNAIIVDTSIAAGGAQLIQLNQVPHIVSVNFGLPNYQYSEAVTLSDDCIYFLGGSSSSGNVKTVKRFDPATNTSTSATSMNT